MINRIKNLLNNKLRRGFDSKLDITKDDLEIYIRNGAIIVDVRSPQEFEEGHINGAICIPKYEIKRKAEKILTDKNDIIVLYCSTGHRSREAQAILRKLGYENVFNVYGGIII